ncbi:MAG: hypothetical protein N2111_09610 [Candidatus Sumerlaeaceae bacterium]|nr:hypothetical protein [Candidatus Sumerlaeaceae bacterium]
MIPSETLADLLNAELSRKTCSFAEYITASAPYVPPGADELLTLVERMARSDREQAAALEDMIVDLGGIPQPGVYDEGVADTNYLNIVYLSELLVRSRRSSLEQFRKRLDDCAGYPAARELLLRIIEVDTALLREMEAALEKHNPKPAATEAGANDASIVGAASGGSGERPSKAGFDLKSFLARRGPSKTRPPAKASGPATNPSTPPSAQQAGERAGDSSEGKKPFDMKAYLAARKARKDPEAEPPATGE